jgi:hypothetical protein
LLEEDMAVTSIAAIKKSPSLHVVRWAFLHPKPVKECRHVFS